MTAEIQLRHELLVSGLDDIVPVIEARPGITKEQRATTERQQRVLAWTRSLVDDGLMEFVGWENLTLDESMARDLRLIRQPSRRLPSVNIRRVDPTYRCRSRRDEALVTSDESDG
jgi:hypothetical protein